MSAIGFAITKLTSQFGLLSRKASIRLATQTGKKLVDKTNQVGRALNKTEIEEVFTETLPKRCRPKLYTTKEELVNGTLLTDKAADDILEGTGGLHIPNFKGREKVFINIKNKSKEDICDIVSHELEHSLEYKSSAINEHFKALVRLPLMSFKFLKTIVMNSKNIKKSDLNNIKDTLKNKVFQGTEIEDKLYLQFGKKITDLDEETLRSIIRDKINPSYITTTELDYTSALLRFDCEVPAYKVGDSIREYMGLAPENRHKVYKKIQKLLIEELNIFKENRKRGALVAPKKKEYYEDFSRLVPNEEDRKFIMNIAQKPQDKKKIYDALSYFETDVGALRKFLDKNGLTIGKDVKLSILQLDADVLKRDNIMAILKERKMLIE